MVTITMEVLIIILILLEYWNPYHIYNDNDVWLESLSEQCFPADEQ